jgi:hypothetical protein
MSISEKRAALELHGLSTADREWVLGRLAPTEQARVKPLLVELDQMNVRFDAASVAEGGDAGTAPRPSQSALAKAPASARSIVHDADASAISRLLSSEPSWVANALLALDAWPWSAAVRESLALRAPAARNGVTPAALGETLLSLVAERLQAPAPAAINGHRNGHSLNGSSLGVWDRVWPRVRRWLP